MDLLIFFTLANHLAIPILGILWMGIRRERMENQKMLNASLFYIRNTKSRRRFGK